MVEFQAWPKISRLYDSRNGISVTEKIDGTNAAIHIEDGQVVGVQSRKRLISVDNDNFGFARWVEDRKDVLADKLGDGIHFGEFWGSGIQRTYGLQNGDKRFSLFNAVRWAGAREHFDSLGIGLSVVPEVYRGGIENGLDEAVQCALIRLVNGSLAAPGFRYPEGVVVYFLDARTSYKVIPQGWEPNSKKATRG